MKAQSESKKLKVNVLRGKNSGSKASSKSASSTGEKEAPQSLDQVRDILFGAQSRDQEKRFGRIEERLQREASELRNDLKFRCESLEQFIRKEVELLGSRLKAEQGVRADLIKDLGRELKDLTKTVDRKVRQLDDQLNKGQSELHQRILDQHKSLSEDVRQKSDTLKRTMKKALDELTECKVEKTALSEMLITGAMSLNDDLKLSGANNLAKSKS